MEQLIDVSSRFPTVVFSVLLGIMVIYWLVGLLGLIDLDLGGDADIDVDADSGSAGALGGLFLTFGLSGVPFTIVVSIVVLFCWLISFYLQHYILELLPQGYLYYVVGAIANVVIFFLSLPVTAVAIRPLKGMFKSAEAATSYDFVGKEATVATGSVTETFGQAKLFNEGAEILLDVRCAPEHTLKMGDKVLVVEYLTEQHAYIIAPYSI